MHRDPPPTSRCGVAALAVAGIAIAAFARERRLARRSERLGGAALETLLYAIDANDPVTGAHVRRVARYALALAHAMRLDRHTCSSIERVALFHDVGKIDEALFDVIHEPAAMSPADRRAIRIHPRRGAEVVAPLAAFYPDLAEGILSHHERWDGTGYPRGLAGEAIPLAARIVAIADTFDAVTHTRRYRAGAPADVARARIAAGRGTQFDPALVDAFLSRAVVRRVDRALREANRASETPEPRRVPGRVHPTPAPDISFRWRGRARAPLPRDPARPARR